MCTFVTHTHTHTRTHTDTHLPGDDELVRFPVEGADSPRIVVRHIRGSAADPRRGYTRATRAQLVLREHPETVVTPGRQHYPLVVSEKY